MKQLNWLVAATLPLLMTACGGDEDFQGRYIGPEGVKSYQFLPEGKLEISEEGEVKNAEYDYDSGQQTITLMGNTDLPDDTLTVTDEGNLEMTDAVLTRGVDYEMLNDATWIGHEGDYTFSLTFEMTEKGLETLSELVTYYEDDKTFMSQTDDSITRLTGNMLFLDSTAYTVSDVTEDSFTITIGNNSMALEKHPKGTEVEYREGYESLDE